MATPADDLDEKSLMSFVDSDGDERASDAAIGNLDSDCGGSGPHSSILHTSAAGARPPSTRSSNYRASLNAPAPAAATSTPQSSPLSSSPSRRLPEITFDLSSSSSSASVLSLSAVSSSSTVSLPDTKKKPFLMSSLAVGLNEIIPTDDDFDGRDRVGLQTKFSGSHSPKRFQLELPQRSSPSLSSSSHALGAASPKHSASNSNLKASSPTHSSSSGGGSKLLPINLGTVSVSGGGSLRTLLKFDPILGSKSTSNDARADAPSGNRRTIASHSPLHSPSTPDSDYLAAPSKLDPLDAESIRGTSFAPSGTSTSERKSAKLSSSASASPEKATQPPQSRGNSKSGAPISNFSSPSPNKPVAQPKFRNLFKKSSNAARGSGGDKSFSEADAAPAMNDGEDKQGSNLLDDSPHVSASLASSSAGVAALAPMDELNYLSFSPRAITGTTAGTKTAATRDLPSLSLSSNAKDAKDAAAAAQSPELAKKVKDKHAALSDQLQQAAGAK